MNSNILLRKIRYFVKDYYATLLTLVSIFVIFILLSTSYKSYKETLNEYVVIEQEVKLLKNRTDTLRLNKSLTADQITEYNRILSTLIPDSEDYFSIIYALEAVASESGFNIVGYTINFAKSSREKLSITVEGRGNTGTFLKFLSTYQFAGARLITSEKIDYSSGVSTTKIQLNFYAKKFAFNESVVPQLTEKDMALLDKIKNKISVNFTTGGANEDATDEYETKENPF